MSSAVKVTIRDDIAILAMNSPPVNALGYSLRQGLIDGLKVCSEDKAVKYVILTGSGRTFCAGADITEFSAPVMQAPTLFDVTDAMESSEKPIIAAIHGYAFGGGLELALFCHYRIASKTARVGFPEVEIGLLPGAAGTQRLPRVAPLAVAMAMISTGKPITSSDALKYGIIDKIVDGDIVNEAVKFCKTILRRSVDVRDRRVSRLPVRDVANKDRIFQEAMSKVKKRSKGLMAPVLCLQSVKAAADMDYDRGVKRERELMAVLLGSSQARALQYAFFAERLVSKWELPSKGNYKTAKPVRVKTVAVVGTGTMGSGIAVALLTASLPTLVIDQNPQLLKSGVERIKSLIQDGVRLGKRTAEQAQHAISLLKPVSTMAELKHVDLVIEAVFENMSIKQKIFQELDEVCNPRTILCTNTSTLDIDRIASATSRPDRVIGTHFFVPAYHMRLLENIYGSETSLTTTATVMELGKTLGKVTVLVGNCHGFCANRLNNCKAAETMNLVEEGATPEQVDNIMEDFGFPIGPLKVSDLSGLDVGYLIKREVLKDAGLESKAGSRIRYMRGSRTTSLSDVLYEAGRLGRKSGAGWYLYDKPGGKVAIPDEQVTDMIVKYCSENGIERRKIPAQEIVERSIYPVINEGFRLLEEGIVTRPEDIDICWLHGFGWPRYLGGPMFYATQIGLRRVYERICHYYGQHPDIYHWQPSELLTRLATRNVPLKDWKTCLARDSKL